MKINICGIPHTVVEIEDKFNADTIHYGQIEYSKCEITINKNIPDELKKETLCHEIVHGMLYHLGFFDQYTDERLVQALGNAIYQSFDIKIEEVPDEQE